MKYLRPPCIAGVIGPQRSPWTSSRVSITRYFAVFGNDNLLCFLARQLSHTYVLDVRQPSHHLLQPTKSVEAEMSIPGMPQPRLLRAPCSQADGLLHLQVEQVQLVLGPLHLSKKPLLPVLDPEDVVLDQLLAATLIQLANADEA